jgi:hypothetical protein
MAARTRRDRARNCRRQPRPFSVLLEPPELEKLADPALSPGGMPVVTGVIGAFTIVRIGPRGRW